MSKFQQARGGDRNGRRGTFIVPSVVIAELDDALVEAIDEQRIGGGS